METYLHVDSCRATRFKNLLVIRLPFAQDGVQCPLIFVLEESVISSRDGGEDCAVCH